MNTLLIKRLSENATIPVRSTQGSAGLDVFSSENVLIEPNSQETVKTDIAIKCPGGTYARLADRSSLALKKIHLAAGVIDNDFTGPVKAILQNYGEKKYQILKGDRICQMIITHISMPCIMEVDELPYTQRNVNGFGSTGI